MKWKVFITAFISIVAIGFPANIIGCGPEADPYDYFISFFSKDNLAENEYQSFFFTRYSLVYDNSEKVTPEESIAKEWAAYCGKKVTVRDARLLVMNYSPEIIEGIKAVVEKKKNKHELDSLQNSMKDFLLKKKDLDAINYLIYAKELQTYVTGGESYSWEVIKRDSVSMAAFIDEGIKAYKSAKKDFFKLKYAYQVVRLAHYSKRYEDAIKYYDEYIAGSTTQSVLQPMSLSLKAGAFYHLAKNGEAAYLFSKTFTDNDVKRISNYYGFAWSVIGLQDRALSLQLCTNDKEKADLQALFALSSTSNEVDAMKEVYKFDPGNKILETLVLREINKLEEKYMTRTINEQKGGYEVYMWYDETIDTINGRQWAKDLAAFLHKVAMDKKVSSPAFFETGAAHTYLMSKDFTNAGACINSAKQMNPTQKLKDQLEMTAILLSVNEIKKIDAGFENALYPKLKWLLQKTTDQTNNANIDQWKRFYRELLRRVIAKRYHGQGDIYKESLAIGNAIQFSDAETDWHYNDGINFLRAKLESRDVEKLYSLMLSNNKSSFEKFLVENNSINLNNVIEFAGTVYLREYNYLKAIEWFKKDPSSEKNKLGKDPFIELLYDRQEAVNNENGSMTKFSFAQEMFRLEGLIKTDKKNAAKYYYKTALGLYNMTFYGHTWYVSAYNRVSTSGYFIPADASSSEREFYGCFKAHDYFKKAMDASDNKSFKAKCLFMMAKCAQKQVRLPRYDDPPDAAGNIDGYETYESYNKKFRNSKYFPQFVKEYSNTAFYKEAFNSCSYLRDFVRKK